MKLIWALVSIAAAALSLGGCTRNVVERDAGETALLIAEDGNQPSKLDLRITGTFAKAIAMAYALAPGTTFTGSLVLRPSSCSPANPDVSDTSLNFDLSASAKTLCVFQALPIKGSTGKIVPAQDVPYCVDGEPVYELQTGAVVCTGTRPVAKGPRTRAGAPGTWYAIEIVGDKEYHYFLKSETANDLIEVHTGAAGPTDRYKKLMDTTKYLEVLSDGTINELALADDAARKAAWDKYYAIADKCRPASIIDRKVILAYWQLLDKGAK